MAAPPKPWERMNHAVLTNQRQALYHPDRGILPTQGSGGGSYRPIEPPPPLPPRPGSLLPSTMSRTYGSYSPYSPYGGYGSSLYSGYGGYNRYNMMGSGDSMENEFIHVAEESSRQAFQSIESIVHAFGSVSMMLESTYHAVYSSFRAVLGVAEHFSRMRSHFAQIFSALAVVRTLKWILKKLLYLIGLRSQDPNLEEMWRASANGSSSPVTEADLKASKSSWPIVMFLGVVLGSPYVIWRLLSSLVKLKQSSDSQSWRKGTGEHYGAVTAYGFQAGSKKELPFRAGQYLVLAPKDLQPQVRGWLLASDGNNVGLVPSNYLRILGIRTGPPQQRTTSIPDAGSRKVTSGIPSMPMSKQAGHFSYMDERSSHMSEASNQLGGGIRQGTLASGEGVPKQGKVQSNLPNDPANAHGQSGEATSLTHAFIAKGGHQNTFSNEFQSEVTALDPRSSNNDVTTGSDCEFRGNTFPPSEETRKEVCLPLENSGQENNNMIQESFDEETSDDSDSDG